MVACGDAAIPAVQQRPLTTATKLQPPPRDALAARWIAGRPRIPRRLPTALLGRIQPGQSSLNSPELELEAGADRQETPAIRRQLAHTFDRTREERRPPFERHRGTARLPGLVERLLDEEAWQEFDAPAPVGHVEHGSFGSFLTSSPPRGLGGRRDQLVALCGRDEKLKGRVQRLLDGEVDAATGPGGDRRSEDFQVRATNLKRSDTAERVVARLKRDRPDLADRVVAGELTANAAAHQAGIRKPRIVLTSPEAIARALRRNLDADGLAELVRLLTAPDAT